MNAKVEHVTVPRTMDLSLYLLLYRPQYMLESWDPRTRIAGVRPPTKAMTKAETEDA